MFTFLLTKYIVKIFTRKLFTFYTLHIKKFSDNEKIVTVQYISEYSEVCKKHYTVFCTKNV